MRYSSLEDGDSTRLIDEVLAMIVTQFLGSNDAMHIRLHKFLHKIHLCKVIKTWRSENVEDRDDVFVMKVAQKFDLT